MCCSPSMSSRWLDIGQVLSVFVWKKMKARLIKTRKNRGLYPAILSKTLENKDLLCNQNKILCSQTKLACCRCSDSGEWHEMKGRKNSILGLQYFSTWALLSEYLEQTRTMQELILPAWEASQSEHRIHFASRI